jgi:aminoglycoside phosphotransferase (APT) family kinase protein
MSDAALDPLAILELLGLHGPARVSPVTGGADMAIWRVEHDGAAYALRVFRAEQAAAFQREIAAMRAAAVQGLPVPAIEAEGVWRERPVMLLRWMPGRPLGEELSARPWLAWPLGVAFGQMQARLHQIDAPDALRSEPYRWINWADPDDALRERLLGAATLSGTLLHLDYHPLNVLVADRQISAILDWTNACTGDCRADLARTAAILRFAPLPGLPAPLSTVVRRTFIAGWRHGYRKVAGPLHGMAPFYAWAGMLMVRDLSPRLGRPDLSWLTPAFLNQVQSWADVWQQRLEG